MMDMEVDEVVSLEHKMSDEEDEEDGTSSLELTSSRKEKAREHKEQLERLKEKDPEFYEFLKEHDNELLDFKDEDIGEDTEPDMNDADIHDEDDIDDQDHRTVAISASQGQKASKSAVTMEMVESWCKSVQDGKISPIRNLMKAFRTACHYGDDNDDSSSKLQVMSSHVFNRVMSFVLTEMDRILRNLTKLPPSGGKKETILDLKNTKLWKKYNHLVKSYLANTLHVLNQMTDAEMISFTLRRLRYSSVFLVAFPSLLRKYIKVALHFWGTGVGTLPIVALLFLRDLCVRIGSDCVDECFKGIYKTYVLNCHFVTATHLQHVHFLGNCVIELFGVDIPIAYQHAFIFIRQLAMILREALNTKTKEASRKVHEWKYINCLELWTRAVCTYSSAADFRPLAYPLTQIISGVARLVPSARYFPLRLRCVRMLNRIAAATNTFIPVSLLLLDMLDMKELNRPPTGGVGKAVDLHAKLKVSKPIVKTRSFQEACVFNVLEELAEHLSQWSYSVAFFELSFVPMMRLRTFCKHTKVERFRREIKQLIHQIEANSQFTNEKRASIPFLPNDPAAALFLEDEKKSGASPLSKYVVILRERELQRNKSLTESSVLVGAKSSLFGKEGSDSDEEDETIKYKGARVFSSSWLPGKDCRDEQPKAEQSKDSKNKKKKRKLEKEEPVAEDEDIVQDLVLSSDEEDESLSDTVSPKRNLKEKPLTQKQNKQKPAATQKQNKMDQKQNNQKRGRNQKQNKKKPSRDSSENNLGIHRKGNKRKRSG